MNQPFLNRGIAGVSCKHHHRVIDVRFDGCCHFFCIPGKKRKYHGSDRDHCDGGKHSDHDLFAELNVWLLTRCHGL